MENLNAEQIIKALECCTSGRPCRECSYKDKSTDTFGCRKQCLIDALALIKELTAEYDSMAKSVIEADELIRKLRADKKELTEENEAWQKQLITAEEQSGKAYYKLANPLLQKDMCSDLKVIGNVIDNPELLTEERIGDNENIE